MLLPAFSAAHDGVHVRLIAVGSGQAMALGRRRDADVLLVHAPEAEHAFMAGGHGRARLPVMYSDYVIVGPTADPAVVNRAADAADALRRIVLANALFVSRGDDSGTHHRELELWRAAGWPDPPAPPNRIEAGQGMGETLMMASEREGYTLTDRATWLALADVLSLTLLLDGDARLTNPYSVITVAGAANEAGADLLAAWLTSDEAARLIVGFGSEASGHRVFTAGAPPAAAGP